MAQTDSLYLVRAEGQERGVALAEPIGQVVTLYKEAVAIEPDNLEITWKLLQALEYKAAHAPPNNSPDRGPVFDHAREASESALDLAAATLDSRKPLYKASTAELEKQGIDETTLSSVYFWGTVDWAGWAKAHGIFAAATQRVAGRLFENPNQVLRSILSYKKARAIVSSRCARGIGSESSTTNRARNLNDKFDRPARSMERSKRDSPATGL